MWVPTRHGHRDRPPTISTPTAALPPQLKFHALRHTYVSLCVAVTPVSLCTARERAAERVGLFCGANLNYDANEGQS
jgi:hypothetical protein